jgi:pimeloyl-ACP methyl ester carboxylesterase
MLLLPFHGAPQAGHCETKQLINGKVYRLRVQNDSLRFNHAWYSLFVPDGMKIKGALIHQHGCTMEGLGASTAHDIQYQALAKKWGLVIIAPDLYPNPRAGCNEWRNPEDGSAMALLEAIDRVAELSGHPEFKTAPWLLWGHSGGGYWVLAMMRQYPERILGVTAYSPAFNPQWDYSGEALKIPLLIRHAGAGDLNGPNVRCWETAINTFGKLREKDAPVAIAHTPGETHNLSYLRYMTVPFFEAILKQRLPDKTGDPLKDIDPSLSWVGDTLTHQVYESSTFSGDKKGMSVLPDSVSALAWQEYVSTNTVVDKTAPFAPHSLKWVDNDSVMTLHWQADADIESGIHHFNIYKNNRLIGRFPATEEYQTFDTNADNALPDSVPCMHYPVKRNEVKRRDTYAVSTVNHFNQESPRSHILYALLDKAIFSPVFTFRGDIK